ncbi:WYL domain-containing protein [Vagococcus silagei]|uniref:WYL domain-containing protein n=1 Tax=Vagococcus silagei TaxID=2508885 RepID=A0A4S3AZZ1_9ENTE|nr:WYL domain-containing protein [Vagococcus silagei]THB60321.1 WYL domain-containing protein [Vagococcus silagei]
MILELTRGLSETYLLPKVAELNQKMNYFKQDVTKKSPYFFDFSLWKAQQAALKSIETGQVISITYTSYDNKQTMRKIEPINLVFKAQVWYLYAYCRIRKDNRLFRINRIRNIQFLDTYFKQDKHQAIDQDFLARFFKDTSSNGIR